MGNFLDTPVVEKETEVAEDAQKGLSYGLSAMQGWRAQMEDDHVNLLSLPGLPDLSLFGVYDGHGGDMVAHYVAKHFPARLVAAEPFAAGMPAADDLVDRARRAFEESVMGIDAEIRQLQEVESGQDQSGTTSVMTLVSATQIICANTGDSRACLSRDGVAVPLSNDHKPFNPGEKERIENAGSHVKFNRVNGDLAVSRALGDFVYKRCETVTAERQAVTALPEFMVEARQPAKDEFIVLACDGIWDVMSSQEVVEKVGEMLREGRPEALPRDDGAEPLPEPPAPGAPERPWDLGAVCECLIDHCLRLGSRDNMSVIIVLLAPGAFASGAGAGAPVDGAAAGATAGAAASAEP